MAKQFIAAIIAVSTLSACVDGYPRPAPLREPEDEKRKVAKPASPKAFESIIAVTGNYLTFNWD